MDVNILNMKISKLVSSCCPTLWSGHLNPAEAESLAAIFRILGEPARLQILSMIAAQPEGEVCACGLTEPLGLSQPTVSHHLKLMYEAGLLQKERRGTWIYYRLVPERFEVLHKVLAMPAHHSAVVR
jgi:ArsR family transcriptional regulator